jgi:4-diphosphocytidyl-2-C-methyl-D-erythritol kinase
VFTNVWRLAFQNLRGWPPVLFSETFTLRAFAKINWTLHVLGRRADGYHELQTVFQTVTLHDNLTFEASLDERIALECDDPDIPIDQNNLIVRAAEALRQGFGIRKGASIRLEKRIPSAGGLGGGSSNAAIAMLGLSYLWALELTRTDLEEMGAVLGADVPFFFTGGTALGTGLGTQITSLSDAPEAQLLIVTPDVKVSTAEAYRALNSPALTKVGGDTILSSSRLRGDFSDSLYGTLKNDFEVVIFALHPEIMRVRDVLMHLGARNAMLAGSGASVFGVFDNVEAQERAADAMRSETGWRVFKCATLSRDSYLKDLGDCAALVAGRVSSRGRI